MTLASTIESSMQLPQSSEPWKPRPYQLGAVEFLVNHPAAALLQDPGLGKTSEVLAALKLLMKAKGVKKVLVVAPLRVCYEVWTHSGEGELGKWDDFLHYNEVLLHGPKKEERLLDKADLYVINFDGLEWLNDLRIKVGRRSLNGLQYLMQVHGVNTLVVDELSKLKHPKTKRFKALKPFLELFQRRWGLTGSPAANGLIGLFGQMYVVDLGVALGRYISHYRYQYFMPAGYGGHTWVPQANAEKRIYKAVSKVALAQKAQDFIKLPKLMENNIWVSLPPKAMEVYQEMEDELIASIEGEEITAANAAVASNKCRQIASGGIYADLMNQNQLPGIKRRVIELHNAKTDALVDLVEELQEEPLLIGYDFIHDLDRIQRALGKVPVIGGGTSPKEASRLIAAWNRGELPVLCGHPQSIGHGLNLQSAGHHICWYSLTWDYELYDQLIRRVWRPGQKHSSVMVHRILARKTVDEVVLAAIKRKRTGQLALFDALKAMALRRKR